MDDSYNISQLSLLETVNQTLKDSLRFRPAISFEDWATRYIINPDGTPFRFRETQLPIARDLFNPSLTSVCIRAFSGAGKTYLFAAGLCYVVEQLRTAAGVMFPSQSIAEDWVNEELHKMFLATPAIEKMEMETDLKRLKRWNSGAAIHAIGSNSSGMIRRLQAPVLYADEIDAITQEKNDEGDKLAQFFKRARGEKNQYKWASSYPSLKGHSKIDAMFDQSDQCRWFVTCPKCEHEWEMQIQDLNWKTGEPESAVIVCPSCGERHDDESRLAMAKAGRFLDKTLSEPRDSGERGFHLNCLANVGEHSAAYNGYLHEIAAEIERGKKADSPEKAKRVFVNTMLAESYAEQVESKPEPHILYARREEYNPGEMLPADVLMLTAGVDWQKNRCELIVMGWGDNAESWGVAYKTILGSPMELSTWQKLDKELSKRYAHPIAGSLGIVCTMIDSGKWQDAILAQTHMRTRQRIYGCKGARTIDRVLMDNKPTRIGAAKILQYHIGTHEAKETIYSRLDLKPDEDGESHPRGFIHFPKTAEFGPSAGGEATGFFEMLLAEDSVIRRSSKTGEFVRFFECQRGQRNEALDCMVYAMAAERRMSPKYEEIARNMLK